MLRTVAVRNTRLLKHMVNLSACQTRHRSNLPLNTIILFVPQQEAWIVERFGKFQRILQPGLNFLFPVIDSVKYVQSLKELAIDIPQQAAITSDNVTLQIDGVLYLRIIDPHKASYGVEDPQFAITQLAQTTMRSELGKIALDVVFREREVLNVNIVESINKAADAWGITCLRYEIRDIRLPDRVQIAMQMQVEAERKKRAAVLESEGIREAEINVAEGKKKAKILNSEAFKTEQINNADGEAEAILAKARAKANAIMMVAQAISNDNGVNAVSYNVAEQYVSAFGNLAQKGNTVLLPANTGDVSSMVSQAMAIYNNLSKENISNEKQTMAVHKNLSQEGILDDKQTVALHNLSKKNILDGNQTISNKSKDDQLSEKSADYMEEYQISSNKSTDKDIDK